MSDPDRDPAVALLYACPYCGALPGEPCDTPLDTPHYSRTPDTAVRALPGHPVKDGAGYDCCCGACLEQAARKAES